MTVFAVVGGCAAKAGLVRNLVSDLLLARAVEAFLPAGRQGASGAKAGLSGAAS